MLSGCNRVFGAVFTRHGGASKGPYTQLNVSYNVGDDPGSVAANLSKIKSVIGAQWIATMTQVHGDNIFSLRRDNLKHETVLDGYDALVTDVPGVALIVKLADCQGVIFFCEKKNVIAIAHCGWRGNVAGILKKVVGVMEREYGCDPGGLKVAISPSLGPCCGEFKGYEHIFPLEFSRFMVRENYFDLWAISRDQLVDAGVKRQNIETAEVCTRCHADLFFSYRASKVTGRFAMAAMLID